MISQLFRECFRGKSLARLFTNIHFKDLELSGKGIDLGAKSANGSYYESLCIKTDEMTFVDYYHGDNNKILKLDLEKPFNISKSSYDFAMAFYILEHIFDTENFFIETNNCLKKNGLFIGAIPFLHQYHADPDDFIRLTPSFIEKMAIKHNFEVINIQPLGVGMFTSATHLIFKSLKFNVIRFLISFISIYLDKILSKFFIGNKNFYIAVAFKLKKSND